MKYLWYFCFFFYVIQAGGEWRSEFFVSSWNTFWQQQLIQIAPNNYSFPHAVSFSLHRCLYPRETWNSVLQPPAVYKCSKTFQASFSKLMYSFRCDQKWHFGRAKRILKRGQSPQTSMCTHTHSHEHTHTYTFTNIKKKYITIYYIGACIYLYLCTHN